MNDHAIQTLLVEPRVRVFLPLPSNAGLALTLFETREAIKRTYELIHRSDRLIASLSTVLCRQFPAKAEWTANAGVFFPSPCSTSPFAEHRSQELNGRFHQRIAIFDWGCNGYT